MSNHDSYSDSLVALYCLSSDSQHNPRLRSGAGRSIVTTTVRKTGCGPFSGLVCAMWRVILLLGFRARSRLGRR